MKRPWFAFEVTASCTRSCVFCYNCWKAPGGKPPRQLTCSEAVQLLGKLSGEASPAGITLTGGEPLLRDDLEEIASACARVFPSAALSTTGDGLTPARASRMFSAGLRHYEVALVSADRTVTNRLCGSSGEASRRAISMLSGLGAFVTASALLCRETAPGIRDTVLHASALGARAVVLNPFHPSGAGSGRADLALSRAELAAAALEAAAASRIARVHVYFGTAVRRCEVPASALEGCPSGPCVCGSGKWAIGPDGELRPCEQSPVGFGSLLEESFGELESCAAADAFRAEPESCRSCGSLSDCRGGCRPERSRR